MPGDSGSMRSVFISATFPLMNSLGLRIPALPLYTSYLAHSQNQSLINGEDYSWSLSFSSRTNSLFSSSLAF